MILLEKIIILLSVDWERNSIGAGQESIYQKNEKDSFWNTKNIGPLDEGFAGKI
jgi:hypothetical protein